MIDSGEKLLHQVAFIRHFEAMLMPPTILLILLIPSKSRFWHWMSVWTLIVIGAT